MTLTLIVEIVVAVLLLITLGISLVLNRRLGNLRANQEEMRRLISEFDKALAKARAGMTELKTASAAADSAHEERMKQAKTLRDELGFMIETADRLADRLAGEASSNRAFKQQRGAPAERAGERPAEAARSQTPVMPFPARKPPFDAGAREFRLEPRSEAERELLMALRQAR
ncbi:MAG TPA: DUF6468 domain-containing protein [Ferrovibrio sp.]|jgi:hypothetical protein|uniref:DUF6468 domain-containing protein n=1 Tax=Ferrovibrio sp. TaxID=1917215 RepID=UPI002B4B1A3C|nr:DUF6468 domain-containing protein [Ferrovibrio sp.]HLT76201.1 DUF6468 domain-containing protein [Ferrovibrio sp.]